MIDFGEFETGLTEEKPCGKKFLLPLGYSEVFRPLDDDGIVERCIGAFSEIVFHTEHLGRCARVTMAGHYKGVNRIHVSFCGPAPSIHRFPNGCTLWILGKSDQSIEIAIRISEK